MFKKYISKFLALALALVMLPVPSVAFATEGTTPVTNG